jgi:hypothetical protein
MSSFSIRERPLRSRAANRRNSDPDLVLPPAETLAFVLPALPTLRSISIGGENATITAPKARQWDRQFQAGWKEGLVKVSEWAMRVIERYERAVKVARQWEKAEEEAAMHKHGKGQHSKHTHTTHTSHTAGKHHQHQHHKQSSAAAGSTKTKVKPPTDIKLYRYPSTAKAAASEAFHDDSDPTNPCNGLEAISDAHDWLDECRAAVAQVESYLASFVGKDQVASSSSLPTVERPQAVLCTVPDCEGPWRRGDGGERLDGRSVPSIPHTPGCGHLLGSAVWGRPEVVWT